MLRGQAAQVTAVPAVADTTELMRQSNGEYMIALMIAQSKQSVCNQRPEIRLAKHQSQSRLVRVLASKRRRYLSRVRSNAHVCKQRWWMTGACAHVLHCCKHGATVLATGDVAEEAIRSAATFARCMYMLRHVKITASHNHILQNQIQRNACAMLCNASRDASMHLP
jgi:hypothetical protein